MARREKKVVRTCTCSKDLRNSVRNGLEMVFFTKPTCSSSSSSSSSSCSSSSSFEINFAAFEREELHKNSLDSNRSLLSKGSEASRTTAGSGCFESGVPVSHRRQVIPAKALVSIFIGKLPTPHDCYSRSRKQYCVTSRKFMNSYMARVLAGGLLPQQMSDVNLGLSSKCRENLCQFVQGRYLCTDCDLKSRMSHLPPLRERELHEIIPGLYFLLMAKQLMMSSKQQCNLHRSWAILVYREGEKLFDRFEQRTAPFHANLVAERLRKYVCCSAVRELEDTEVTFLLDAEFDGNGGDGSGDENNTGKHNRNPPSKDDGGTNKRTKLGDGDCNYNSNYSSVGHSRRNRSDNQSDTSSDEEEEDEDDVDSSEVSDASADAKYKFLFECSRGNLDGAVESFLNYSGAEHLEASSVPLQFAVAHKHPSVVLWLLCLPHSDVTSKPLSTDCSLLQNLLRVAQSDTGRARLVVMLLQGFKGESRLFFERKDLCGAIDRWMFQAVKSGVDITSLRPQHASNAVNALFQALQSKTYQRIEELAAAFNRILTVPSKELRGGQALLSLPNMRRSSTVMKRFDPEQGETIFAQVNEKSRTRHHFKLSPKSANENDGDDDTFDQEESRRTLGIHRRGTDSSTLSWSSTPSCAGKPFRHSSDPGSLPRLARAKEPGWQWCHVRSSDSENYAEVGRRRSSCSEASSVSTHSLSPRASTISHVPFSPRLHLCRVKSNDSDMYPKISRTRSSCSDASSLSTCSFQTATESSPLPSPTSVTRPFFPHRRMVAPIQANSLPASLPEDPNHASASFEGRHTHLWTYLSEVNLDDVTPESYGEPQDSSFVTHSSSSSTTLSSSSTIIPQSQKFQPAIQRDNIQDHVQRQKENKKVVKRKKLSITIPPLLSLVHDSFEPVECTEMMSDEASQDELFLVPNELKTDRDVVLSSVQQSGMALAHADRSLRDDEFIVLEAVKRNYMALQFASARLRASKPFILDVVATQGAAFRFASDELRNDREIALTAVGQDPWAWLHVGDQLGSDKEIVLAAVQRDGWLLKYVDEQFRNDKEIVLAALRNKSHAIQFAGKALLCEPEFSPHL